MNITKYLGNRLSWAQCRQVEKIPGILLMLFTIMATVTSYAADTITDKSNDPQSKLIIDDIVCRGNIRTQCSFITKKYYQAIGDILNPDEIADARLRLGTLIQFRNISIHLEKGTQRDHVVVVFVVNEANQIQGDILTNYSYIKNNNLYDPDKNDKNISRTFGTHTSLTDFNFLGTGKELRVSLSADKSSNYQNTPYDDNSAYEVKGDSKSYSTSINYYDPHLFDSTHYYFSAGISYNHTHGTNTSYGTNFSYNNGNIEMSGEEEYGYEASSKSYNLHLGRRFARMSFFGIGISDYRYERFNPKPAVSLNYGWDSQDDNIIPQKGSKFASTFTRNNSRNHIFKLDYTKHFPISENNILSLTGAADYNFNKGIITTLDSTDTTSIKVRSYSELYKLGTRFTHINKLNTNEGKYSAWFAGIDFYSGDYHISDTDDYGFNNTFNYKHPKADLSAGYTYQTDSMIVRFKLFYQTWGW